MNHNSQPEQSSLPLYRNALDWKQFSADYPAPDLFQKGVFQWSRDEIRALQNTRFLAMVKIAWRTGFYQRLWGAAGIEPGDIQSLDDIVKLPMFTSDDIKADQLEFPPFGSIHSEALANFSHLPLKLQTSGGTTGKPRPTLFGPVEWEMNGLSVARAMYVQGARPGDIMQHPGTPALANYPWSTYKACHDYLGIMPLTTGSGIINSSRQQIEMAEDWGTTIWHSFPEYLTQLAKVYRDEFGKDVRDLSTKFICSFLGPDISNQLRTDLEELWGCKVYDNYGAHEIGISAFECQAQDGLHLHEDLLYFEFSDAETGELVEQGEPGNLVVTNLYRSCAPLIRYNMNDLCRVISTERCSCGGTFARMDKFLGRSDDMAKVRGVNIYPMACLASVKSDARTTGEWFCLVDRHVREGVIRDEMTIRVEVQDGADRSGLEDALATRFKADLGIKVAVELVGEGALTDQANIGKEGKPKRLLDRRNKSGNAGVSG